MLHDLVSAVFRLIGGDPCFRVYGKGRDEAAYHIIDVFATSRRNLDSRWPLFRATCITWTSSVIAVGWDFAETLIRELALWPASREHPAEVLGGRLSDPVPRLAANGPSFPRASEILAHECGHSAQARRLGLLYWPIGAALTLCREGRHWYNRFENQASETGIFGGIVPGTVCERLQTILRNPLDFGM